MSTSSENAFEVLAAGKKSKEAKMKSEAADVKVDDPAEPLSLETIGNDTEESSWTNVQSATKTRRLVPQHSLSSKDLGADSPANRASQQESAKKKVTRFTKEELMKLRPSNSKILPSMSESLEILSLSALDPVEKLEPEDVIRIWNTEKANREAQLAAAGGGRGGMGGRGGGRGGRGAGGRGEEHQPGQVSEGGGGGWSRGSAQPAGNSTRGGGASLWDDSGPKSKGGGKDFDLADFAAAALKFRAEMQNADFSSELESERRAGGGGGSGPHPKDGEDMMDRLLREQQDETDLLAGEEWNPDDDDDELPDWADDNAADDDDDDTFGDNSPSTANEQSGAKRNLLMETLNVKSQPSGEEARSTAASAVNSSTSQYTRIALGDLMASSAAAATVPPPPVIAPVAVPQPPPPLSPQEMGALLATAEWFYMDPQRQVQGPFSTENMRMWHEAGYFQKDLPLSMRPHWGPNPGFYPFCLLFPNLQQAFFAIPYEPGKPPSPALLPAQHQFLLQQQQELLRAEQLRAQTAAVAQAQAQAAAIEQQRQQQHQLQLRQQQEQAEEAHRQQLAMAAKVEQEKAMAAAQQAAEEQKRKLAQQQAEEQRKQQQQQQQQQPSQQQSRPAPSKEEAAVPNVTAVVKQRQAQQKGGNTAVAPNDAPAAPAAPTPAPWSKPTGANNGKQNESASLQAIQKEQEEKKRAANAEKGENAGKGKVWGGTGAAAPSSAAPVSDFSQIQKQEAEAKQRREREQRQQQKPVAPATEGASNQLKSLLGVMNKGGAPSPAGATPGGWAAVPAASVWSTPDSPAGATAAPLRDVMQQEAAAAASSGKRNGGNASSGRGKGGAPQPSSWAAKAGIVSGGGFTSAAPVQAGVANSNIEPPKLTVPAAMEERNNASGKQQQRSGTSPVPPQNSSSSANAQQKQKQTSKSGGKSNKSEFGGKVMSDELAEWCNIQLKKISDSGGNKVELTLMEFCLSLDSVADIRETLVGYLGSSPQVTNFATEFIKRSGKSAGAPGGAGGGGGGFVTASKKRGGGGGGSRQGGGSAQSSNK